MGNINFYFLGELILQLIVLSNINSDIGRLCFMGKWYIDQAETKLLGLVIKESYDFCQKNNCNIEYFIFPNVKNITKDSLFRKPMISFSSNIKKNVE